MPSRRDDPSDATSVVETTAIRPEPNPQHKDEESLTSRSLVDPKAIGWDGRDDPANPKNWPKSIRIGHVVVVSIITLIANLASTMFAPGAAELMADFHTTSSILGTLSVTIYLLGFAVGPLVIAPLSELYGRLPIYNFCNGIFLAFTIACAVSTNITMFLVFRFVAGCAGSAPLTIGGGTVADVIPQDERGAAMAIFAVGPLLGPVIGPVAGGFATQALGWRWAFWILAIASGVVSLFTLGFMRETYDVVLLNRKAAKLRVQLGNSDIKSVTDTGLTPAALFKQSLIRPTKLLLLSPIVLSLSVFSAFVFGLTFILFTTFPTVFEYTYGFSTGVSGLAYLGLGVGMFFGVILFAKMSDPIVKKLADGGEMKPEYRLPMMVYLMPVMPIGFFWYGWSVQGHVHWIVPILGTAFIGVGSLFVVMPAQTYLVDAFGKYAASALAANTVLRSLFGTFLPLVGPPMYEELGLGWGNTLLGCLAIAMTPIPYLLSKHGEVIRQKWPVKL